MITPNHSAIIDLRIAARRRIAESINHALTTGRLNRSDIQRIGEVAHAQASADFRTIQHRFPGLISYDWKIRAYRVTGKVADA